MYKYLNWLHRFAHKVITLNLKYFERQAPYFVYLYIFFHRRSQLIQLVTSRCILKKKLKILLKYSIDTEYTSMNSIHH